MNQYVTNIGTDAIYMMGISHWDILLAMVDNIVCWSASLRNILVQVKAGPQLMKDPLAMYVLVNII